MKNKFNLLKIFILGSIFALPFLLTSNAQAAPSAMAPYLEIDLSGGLWKYDYTLLNTLNPITAAGFDIYDFSITIYPEANLSNITSPEDWELISDQKSFITWFSLFLGAHPFGSDIAPGTSLSGFSFISDMRLGSLDFDVTISNPDDNENPITYSGFTYHATTPVPEPGSILLLGHGFIGLLVLGRKYRIM
ncbi:MAG TPA: PEP-CTERM sorting domain-containing protein [Candidatus Limnocylindrales bacterium]|nr:PEP-CTERM sorting domain-containing protein [Candidatus Limnocylindrales bacterium]